MNRSPKGISVALIGESGVLGNDCCVKSRVHPKYKTKYRVSNRAEYEHALVQRGDITQLANITTNKPVHLIVDSTGLSI